jgi:hypothetical protein
VAAAAHLIAWVVWWVAELVGVAHAQVIVETRGGRGVLVGICGGGAEWLGLTQGLTEGLSALLLGKPGSRAQGVQPAAPHT